MRIALIPGLSLCDVQDLHRVMMSITLGWTYNVGLWQDRWQPRVVKVEKWCSFISSNLMDAMLADMLF
jgi:hypothetical protein